MQGPVISVVYGPDYIGDFSLFVTFPWLTFFSSVLWSEFCLNEVAIIWVKFQPGLAWLKFIGHAHSAEFASQQGSDFRIEPSQHILDWIQKKKFRN